jgi:hypothetical protein
VDGLEVDYPKLRKFAKSVQRITIYSRSNTGSLINYGKRALWRLVAGRQLASRARRGARRIAPEPEGVHNGREGPGWARFLWRCALHGVLMILASK